MPVFRMGIVALMLGLLNISPAWADNNAVDYLGLSVREAQLVQEPGIDQWRIKARISNDSTINLVILGVVLPGLMHSTPFKVKVAEGRYADLGSLTLAPEEQLDLSTSHILMAFNGADGLNRQPGDLTLKLHTTEGYLPFVAHLEDTTHR